MNPSFIVMDVLTGRAVIECADLWVADHHASLAPMVRYVTQSNGLFNLYTAARMPLAVLMAGKADADRSR